MNIIGAKIVIDTNIFITIIGKKSPNRWIFDAISTGQFELCLSNEIMLEYEEVLTNKTNIIVSRNVINFLLSSPFVHFIEIYFNWKLVNQDPDDNKFIDCTIAGGAICLVSNDQHFNVVKNIDFPEIRILSLHEFEEEFRGMV